MSEQTRRVRLTIKAKPRQGGAQKSRVIAVHDEANGLTVEVALAARPIDGEANAELVRFLAAVVGIPKSNVRIGVGAASRTKLVDVEGVDRAELVAALIAACKD